jgi:DNA gyrase subunit A
MADDQNPELPLNPPPPNESNGPAPEAQPSGVFAMQGPGAATLLSINLEEEMRRSYLD